MPKVSVVIPTYNRSHIIEETVACVLDQTLCDVEVIVVDDGSSDNTGEVVGRISDSRVKYYYKEGGGPSSARNLGLDKSKGEYISFLDSDDLWPKDYLEKLICGMEQHRDYNAAYSKIIGLHEDSIKREMSTDGRYKSGWMHRAFFEASPALFPSATCFRRSVLKDIFWDENLKGGEDYDFFVRISSQTQFLFVAETEIIKRWQPDNLSSAPIPIGMVNGAQSLERFYFTLGGDKFVPRGMATRKISHRYRKASKLFRKLGNRQASILLAKKAINFHPIDLRLYGDLFKSFLLSKEADSLPEWCLPDIMSPSRSSFDSV